MAENLNLKTVNTVDTRPFKKLVMTIGELPTSFIESMTYYELLAWFTNYLETVIIPTVNNNAEATEELQTLFTELKSYVDNYFDNLDVQDEINNKLDAMVEAGTLQEIVADYLNSKAVFGFDTVADMKSSTNLIDGSYARTLGFYSLNDGGGATYRIREITNSDVVDEKFIVAIGNNDLIAELITSNKVNICQVGGQQNLGAVCNYVISLGKSVYIPKLSFETSTTIELNQDETQFICDGNITFTGTNSTLFRLTSSRNKIEFNGIITCGDTNVFAQIGSDSNMVTNNEMSINCVMSSRIGLWFTPNGNNGVQISRFTFTRITAAEKGIYFNPGDTSTPWINALTFYGGTIRAPYGIVTRKGANQLDDFNDNSFNRISFTGASIECPLDLSHIRNSWFNELRISESLTGDYELILDSCKNLYISNETWFHLPKINVINTGNKYSRNIIKGTTIIDSGGYYVGDQVVYVNNTPYIPKDHLWLYRNNRMYAYGQTTVLTVEPEYYFDDIVYTIGASQNDLDLTYTLPEVFENQVKSFYINVLYKHTNTKLTVNDATGTKIIEFPNDGNAISNKTYYCERGGKFSSGNIPEWKVSEVSWINS